MKKRLADKLWKRAYAHLSSEYADVLDWARDIGSQTFVDIKGKQFLENYCFVIYASGFKYDIIKAKFPAITNAFVGFKLKKIAKLEDAEQAIAVFANRRKAECFLSGAQAIAAEGWPAFKKRLAARGPEMLCELPGIGPITKDHLAKNIGLADVHKSDIWLARAAIECGCDDPEELVDYLHVSTGESRHVIDIALWNLGKDGLLQQKRV